MRTHSPGTTRKSVVSCVVRTLPLVVCIYTSIYLHLAHRSTVDLPSSILDQQHFRRPTHRSPDIARPLVLWASRLIGRAPEPVDLTLGGPPISLPSHSVCRSKDTSNTSRYVNSILKSISICYLFDFERRKMYHFCSLGMIPAEFERPELTSVLSMQAAFLPRSTVTSPDDMWNVSLKSLRFILNFDLNCIISCCKAAKFENHGTRIAPAGLAPGLRSSPLMPY